MEKEIQQIFDDLNNLYLPKNENNWDKVKCILKHGARIYWYYKEDENFAKEEGYNPRDDAPYSGIIIAIPDITPGELEGNDCIVCIDNYPTEKEYPLTDWVAFNRLLDDDTLVEIFNND